MLPLLSVAALALVLFYIYLLSRHVGWGLASLLAAELFHITFGPSSQLLGGIHLDPLDAVSLCLLVAGTLRTIRALRTMNITRFLAVGYLLLFAISLVHGFYSNGILAAANESRSFIGPLTAAIYFLTAPSDQISVRRYTLIYLCFGAALIAVAALAAAGLPLGMNAWADSDSIAVDGRYLPATGAAALAVCGFISLALLRRRKTGSLYQLVPVIYLSAAIYLRHRTVWVMILAGALGLLLLDGRLFRRLLPAASIAAVTVCVLAFYGSAVEGLAGTSDFSQSATSSQTLLWRLNGWKELLFDEDQTPLTVSIGKSMGSGFWRIDPVSDRFVGVAPHSEYIQEFLRVGVLGMLFIVLFALRPLPWLWNLTRTDPAAVYPSTSAWAIVVLITLVYGVTYGIEPHAYALLGIANAIYLGSRVPEEIPLPDLDHEWGMENVPALAE
jgi:hypothetical protein